jgi:hypothetical protein
LQNKRVFTYFCQKLKGNIEKGDVVLDTTRQNTTGHRTTAKKKSGALPHSIWETSADPDSLLAIARFKNNWP